VHHAYVRGNGEGTTDKFSSIIWRIDDGPNGELRYGVKLIATALTIGIPITIRIASPGHIPAEGTTKTITPTTSTATWQFELTNVEGLFQAELFVDTNTDRQPDIGAVIETVTVK
jgi:hypothetical protein